LKKPELKHMESYLKELIDIPCTHTVPASVWEATQFVETRGNIPMAKRMSKTSDLLLRVQDMSMKLVTDALLTKKQVMACISMLTSMELTVIDEGEVLTMRAYAWTELVRPWTSLRDGDSRGIL